MPLSKHARTLTSLSSPVPTPTPSTVLQTHYSAVRHITRQVPMSFLLRPLVLWPNCAPSHRPSPTCRFSSTGLKAARHLPYLCQTFVHWASSSSSSLSACSLPQPLPC